MRLLELGLKKEHTTDDIIMVIKANMHIFAPALVEVVAPFY